MNPEFTLNGVPAARSVLLLTKLRLARLLNRVTVIYGRSLLARKKSSPASGRPATAPKGRNRWLMGGFVGVTMLFTAGNLVRQGVLRARTLGP